ncbi:DUF2544 domain-containing protein [Escherichia coli]|nr:DUF2544 domain-containing protein [Escherichia coli]
MKILRFWACLLVLIFSSTGGLAAKKIATLVTPIGFSAVTTQIHYYLEILTPEGVAYGVYKQHSRMLQTEKLDLVSWSGNTTAPELTVDDGYEVAKSNCVGLEAYDALSSRTNWICENMVLSVYHDGPVQGCPWLVSTYTDSVLPYDVPTPYVGPKVHNSSCPVSVATYDISWSEDYVAHSKVLSLQSTGGTIEKTLPTFSTSGCDSSKVTVTPNQHPITDKQLHDMVVRVDTSSRQPIDSTCRFQYTLNEL